MSQPVIILLQVLLVLCLKLKKIKKCARILNCWTHANDTLKSNPLLMWNCISLSNMVCSPQENLNFSRFSSKYRVMYISGPRWECRIRPTGDTVLAVRSIFSLEVSFKWWLRWELPEKAATLMPVFSSQRTPCHSGLQIHCRKNHEQWMSVYINEEKAKTVLQINESGSRSFHSIYKEMPWRHDLPLVHSLC